MRSNKIFIYTSDFYKSNLLLTIQKFTDDNQDIRRIKSWHLIWKFQKDIFKVLLPHPNVSNDLAINITSCFWNFKAWNDIELLKRSHGVTAWAWDSTAKSKRGKCTYTGWLFETKGVRQCSASLVGEVTLAFDFVERMRAWRQGIVMITLLFLSITILFHFIRKLST